MIRACLFVLLAAVLLAAFARPAAAQGCEPVELVTYNTALLAPPVSAPLDLPVPQRARMIARNILRSRPDVVALQEVFSGEAQDILEDALAEAYPFYVKYVDEDTEIHDVEQDSGLMLFSRLPFLPFDDAPLAGDVIAFADGQRWDHVQFVAFQAALHPTLNFDNLANKGAAMVKLLGPCERHLVVAFTHLQASYPYSNPDEDAKVRTEQLGDIEQLIVGGLTQEERLRSEIYVLGDLNIDGNLATAKPIAGGVPEWTMHFDPSTIGHWFWRWFLGDPWHFDHRPADPALTEGDSLPWFTDPSEGHRLDYLLRAPAAQAMATCAQHLTVAHAIGLDRFGEPLSDHLPAGLSTHLEHPWCNPARARPVARGGESIDEELSQQGMMQWFRVDEAGSYAIDVVGDPGIGFDVYDERDLSRPIRVHRGERTDRGWRYVMPDAPFFVKVRGDQRDAFGRYTLRIHRNRGGDQSDSIALLPAQPQLHAIPSWPLNPQNATWFDFHVDDGDTGALPSLMVRAGGGVEFGYTLYDSAGQRFDPTQFTWMDGGRIEHRGTPVLPPGKYWLEVAPPPWQWTSPGTLFDVEYQTSTTFVWRAELICHEQGDTFGDDTIGVAQGVDDGQTTTWQTIGDFDDGDHGFATALHGRRYARFVYLEVWDLDDGPSANDLVGLDWVSPLQMDADRDDHRAVGFRMDGDYTLDLRLAHTPEPACTVYGAERCDKP